MIKTTLRKGEIETNFYCPSTSVRMVNYEDIYEGTRVPATVRTGIHEDASPDLIYISHDDADALKMKSQDRILLYLDYPDYDVKLQKAIVFKVTETEDE